MGCTNERMTKVSPQSTTLKSSSSNNLRKNINENEDDQIKKLQKRRTSTTSKRSVHSLDSAFIDGEDTGSMRSGSATTSRTNSGGLKRTLINLSAKSHRKLGPREDEGDILQKLHSEGFLTSDTHKSKSGLSFELTEESNQPRKLPPPRLAKLEKRQKRRKLLTQQDIEAKLEKAEQRRKIAEAERLGKIQSLTVKSDIHTALDSFIEHQNQVKEHTQEKVESAAENRAKKFKEMREKLRIREEHAAMVRQRKKSLGPIKIQENGADQLTQKEQ